MPAIGSVIGWRWNLEITSVVGSRPALALAVFLTLVGGIVIAGRYEHLARSRPLH